MASRLLIFTSTSSLTEAVSTADVMVEAANIPHDLNQEHHKGDKIHSEVWDRIFRVAQYWVAKSVGVVHHVCDVLKTRLSTRLNLANTVPRLGRDFQHILSELQTQVFSSICPG